MLASFLSKQLSMNNSYLYIACNGYVLAIDTVNGDEIWRTHLTAGFLSISHTDVNILLSNDVLYAGTNGYLFALDSYNGNIIWQNDLRGMGYNDVAMAIKDLSVQNTSTSEK